MNATTAVLLAVAGVVALANWWSRVRPDDGLELLTKPTVTSVLVAAALAVDAEPSGARPWFVLALAACLLGDIALLPRVDRFVVGLGSFLVGHLLLGAGALVIGVHWAWIAVPLAAGLALAPLVLRPIARGAGSLAVPVVAYFTAITAAGALLAATGRPWAVAGAAAFVVSDSILGWNKFVRPLRWAPVAIMVTYHSALAALVLALI